MANATNISSMLQDIIIPHSSFLYNCSLSADWFIYYLSNNNDTPQNTTAHLIMDALNSWRSQNRMNNLTENDMDVVLQAYWTKLNDSTRDDIKWDILSDLYNNCTVDNFCPRMGFQGNQDLAGRGMLANYVLEASLVMLYAFVLGMDRSGRFKNPGRYEKIIFAFRDSSRAFLDAAMLFSLAMAVATVYTFSSTMIRNDNVTMYAALTSVQMSMWSLFPTIALHAITYNWLLRREKVRKIAWLLISLFNVAMSVLFLYLLFSSTRYPSLDFGKDDKKQDEVVEILSSTCTDWKAESGFAWAVLACFGSTAFFFLFWITLIHNVFKISFLNRIAAFKWLRRYSWLLISILSLTATLGWLGVFIYFRKELSNEKRTGNENMDHTWTFGQIIALATFAPVFVEWVSVCLLGQEDGLTELLSKDFKAVRINRCMGSLRDLEQTDLPYNGINSEEELNDLRHRKALLSLNSFSTQESQAKPASLQDPSSTLGG